MHLPDHWICSMYKPVLICPIKVAMLGTTVAIGADACWSLYLIHDHSLGSM